MNWFLIAMLAPLLWSITNFIDKLLVSRYFKGNVGAMMVFSGLIGFFISAIILIFNFSSLFFGLQPILILIISGVIYVFSLLPYIFALDKEDTSLVVPLFQLIPIFSLLLGMIFLNEFLTHNQLIGGGIIILGAILISLDFDNKKISIKKNILVLMGVSSFGVAVYSLLFKLGTGSLNYFIASFWFYIGMGLAGFSLLFYSPYRKQFLQVFKTNSKPVISLNFINEILNISAVVIINFALILGPMALVWVVNGLQPIFVFIIGFILTLTVPHIIKEKIYRKHLIQKFVAILMVVIGAIILNF